MLVYSAATWGVLLASLLPSCIPLMAGLGMGMAASALLLTGWLLGRLLRALRAKLGFPDPSESRGPRLPGQTVQDVARTLRHDSPGGWTAGETRWTFAHEHGWFNSPDYRTFLLVVVIVTVTWAFGTAFAHELCR
jgi:hypothetical protein